MRTLPLLALLLPACLPALPGDPPKDDPPGESGVTDTGRVDTGEVDTGDSGQTPTGSAPTVTDITLDPAQPRVTDALVVRAEVQDPDGDLLMVGATWTVNGVEPPDGTVVAEQDGDTDRTWVATFPSMDLARRGDTLAVEFLAMDEAGNVTLADPVSTRVLNSDPAVPTPEVYPETPDQDTELTCLSLAPTDADGDTLSTTFAWFVDGVELTGQEGVTLAAGTVSHGSDVSCETHVSDGAGGIVRATSTPVRVIDRTPTLDTVELTPADPRAGEPVLCVPIGAVDPDADPIVARYTFTGDALSVSLDGDETGMELPWSAFSLVRGDTVTCTVELFVDGEGVTSATSTPVTVANTPPSADSLTLTPHDGQAWRVGSWFDCAMVGFEDLDGDTPSDDTACTCSVTTASGDVVPFDATTEPLPEAGTLDCFADAFDGYDAGNRVTASESVTWAPALLDVRFEPAPITAASGLWLTYAVDDPDSRDVTVDIRWYRKRPGATTWILIQSGQDTTLAGPLLRDDQVYAVLIPSDETGAGVTYETRPVTVLDAPTPVASVSVTQQASNDTTQGARPDLRCDATANDADNDTLYLHVAWQRDGEPIDPTDSNVVNTTIHAGSQASADSVVSGAATNPGETWTCQVWTTADAGRVGIDPTDDPTGWTGPGEASIDLPHVRGEHVSLAGRDFRWLPADTFTMGCTALNGGCTGEDRPTHRVTLTRDVWIAEAEVTQPDYTALMGNNPSTWGPASSAVDCRDAGNTCPVDSVSWHDAARYANALSRSEGLPECYACAENGTCAVIGDPYDCDGYRLPTEAEWEAAARCGTEDRYAGTDAYLGNSLTGQPGV
ncbi:MAG: hypothetical protein RLZZ299_3196, partial [Pseudomonadota bacterium]